MRVNAAAAQVSLTVHNGIDHPDQLREHLSRAPSLFRDLDDEVENTRGSKLFCAEPVPVLAKLDDLALSVVPPTGSIRLDLAFLRNEIAVVV